ncbi:cyclopropane fatty acid synthase [Punctularia strigosozonata HHB-11173 SS5]|uniref:cyclopropane fatty acid synthase n=1 Tax=Punctularia strigosozonata (strain HHB-11173) TaxID=741275 RepID=UPI0004416B78|nr:cyclopropane fatty acid synthase [Punctularia strigosozonata HHB-11173 SS5]EIN10178.1 cyclopropane fatty acid synthase [Punctularia strigosozonata HHB-11173 SS5]
MGSAISSPAVCQSQPATAASRPARRSWRSAFARSSTIAFLRQAILIGRLEIQEGCETYMFGQSRSESQNIVYLYVNDEHFWNRVFANGDLGFSEAYMVGEVQVEADNLKGVFDLWLDNESTMSGLSSGINKITSALSGLSNALFGQTLSQSRLNVIAAYDQSNDLFQAFLSREMMYSCAYWGPNEGGVRGDLDLQHLHAPYGAISSASSSTETLIDDFISYKPKFSSRLDDLEAAQHRKIHHALKKLRLRPGDRLLEFGSGWGALAIEASRTYSCLVDTLTLSMEQKRLAEERIREAGLEDRIRVHLMDYRDMPAEWKSAFDAFVSIEMLEHVGSQHYNTYFKLVDWALKPSNARVVISSSTFPESRYTGYQPEDFMRRYMWPNSCLPSATVLVTSAQYGSSGRFTLESVENHSAHYPRTLREWGRRLEQNLRPSDLGLGQDEEKQGGATVTGGRNTSEDDVKLTLRLPSSSSSNGQADFDAIKRKWQYLFAYAAAGFAKGYITCHMISFSKNDQPPVCA